GLLRGGAEMVVSGAREGSIRTDTRRGGPQRFAYCRAQCGGHSYSVVSHHETGILVPEEDAHAIAQTGSMYFVQLWGRLFNLSEDLLRPSFRIYRETLSRFRAPLQSSKMLLAMRRVFLIKKTRCLPTQSQI
ncbi:hypothetical protein BCU47_024715, partial [Enterovibrio norvegicus]